jgi:sulfite reductase alpha subunit-like flavoprotein
MEEDYLEWKDKLFESLQNDMGFQEGAGLDVADFEVRELPKGEHDEAKVFLGELSQRALTGTRGVYDAKNPYPAPLTSTRELFLGGERNCIFAEFDISDAGLRYQAGDHIGIWPLNPDADVIRILKVLGLDTKADTVIDIKSLDPALAKVPFPTPTTYDAIFRHYVDICGLASRQVIGALAASAPNDKAKARLEKLGSDKQFYHDEVAEPCLKLAEVLLQAAGDDHKADPSTITPTVWDIPFDRIVSTIPRLQPRYYSISSSPKLHPNTIHVTAVVLKYTPEAAKNTKEAVYVHGVGTNYLLNLKMVTSNETERLANQPGVDHRTHNAPQYKLEGPRNKFRQPDKGLGFTVPIHVRRSNFRLPTSPKIPIIMIGPGTGVAPFRGFVQERVALARKAKEADGPDALKDWGKIVLFYGCRRKAEDFLYVRPPCLRRGPALAQTDAHSPRSGRPTARSSATSSRSLSPSPASRDRRRPTSSSSSARRPTSSSSPSSRRRATATSAATPSTWCAPPFARSLPASSPRAQAHEVEELLKDILGEAKGGGRKSGEAECAWPLLPCPRLGADTSSRQGHEGSVSPVAGCACTRSHPHTAPLTALYRSGRRSRLAHASRWYRRGGRRAEAL